MRDYALLITMVVLTTVAQVLTRKVAMTTSLRELINLRTHFKQIALVLVAVTLVVLAASCYLLALRNVDLSVAFAFTSLNYAAVGIFAFIFLNERLSRGNIIAIFLITCGVFLVARG
jgi:drug/metabolite transporter (DMT)-like permease